MATNSIFSYTKRDYETARQEGLAQIPIISEGLYTDLNSTDPGIIILDYVHGLVDLINYYQDHQALETFITTAKERVNIFRLAKQLAYKVRSAKGALVDVTFISDVMYDHAIKIPRHTRLSTSSGISFITIDDAYLPSNTIEVTIPCVQGIVITETYQGTGVSIYSAGENNQNQFIKITNANVDIDSISIYDSIGTPWIPVEYIVFSTSTDRVYQVDLEPDDSVMIRFGDGQRGVVPQVNDSLIIEYVVSLAEEGRVGANTIVVLEDTIINNYGEVVNFTVTNYESTTGGSRSQSSRDITALAPGAIKAQNRAVTLTDFESLAKLVEGVADAKAYDINVAPDLCLYHEVKVVIIPTGGSVASTILKNKVYDYLYQRMIPPTNLQILSPSVVPIDIDIVVKQVDHIIEGGVDYTVRQLIEEYFEKRSGAIGENFYPTEIMTEVAALPTVRYVISMNPNSPVSISNLSVATLGNLTITVE